MPIPTGQYPYPPQPQGAYPPYDQVNFQDYYFITTMLGYSDNALLLRLLISYRTVMNDVLFTL